MSPESKYAAVRALRRGKDRYARPVFVGDGLNDAAAMAASHTSIAIASGSDVAMEAAAATLHGDDLRLVPEAVRLARRAVWAVRTNLLWAVSYNLVGMTLAASGRLDPVLAAVLMAASSVLVSWRSFRVTDGLPDDTWQRPEDDSTGRTDGSRGSHAGGVERSASTREPSRLKKALHWLGMIGQAVLLIIIARLGAVSSLAVLLAFGLLTWVALRWWHRMPHWMDMTFAMVTLGGFGMNLGWWADLGFQDAVTPAVVGGRQAAAGGCPGAGDASTVGPAPCGCHSTRSVWNWMNFGMLLLGVPAMFWACYRRRAVVLAALVLHWHAGAGRAWHGLGDDGRCGPGDAAVCPGRTFRDGRAALRFHDGRHVHRDALATHARVPGALRRSQAVHRTGGIRQGNGPWIERQVCRCSRSWRGLGNRISRWQFVKTSRRNGNDTTDKDSRSFPERVRSEPLFLPDLTLWYDWHSSQGTLPVANQNATLPEVAQSLGLPIWLPAVSFRVEYDAPW